ERVEGADQRRRPVALVRVGHLGNQLLGPLQQPAVEWLQLAGRLGGRPEARHVRVVDEELDRVPEGEQPALDLRGRPVAELEVLTRDVLAEHEPDDVGADVPDRKSTRLNSSHVAISYAVFCLKKKIKK